jgi:ABC-type multidrug transport system fused ATPase/permease subunit
MAEEFPLDESIVSLSSQNQRSLSNLNLKKVRADVLKKQEGQMIKDEDEEIKTSIKLYRAYWGKYYGGCTTFLLAIVLLVIFTVCRIGADYIIGLWSEADDQKEGLAFYGGLSGGLTLCLTVLVCCRSSLFLLQNWKATKKLHRDMIRATLNAPVNLYYDVTPIGRILNKFSKDLS